jgi:hypothetical protein
MGLSLTAVVVEEHKVSTDESLESIAKANGLTWQALAEFNWNTSNPREINHQLVEIVGCTKKTEDGKNYKFDNSDAPGIVWVPKKWHHGGLPVDDTHIVRVLSNHCLIIRLVDDRDHPIPDTPYKVTFEDGSVREGSLGRAGLGLIRNPPAGLFSVLYPDHDDILAKSLAGYSHDAFKKKDPGEVFALLQHPPEVIRATFAAYEKYYNDVSGKGWLADMRQTVTDPLSLGLAEAMLAYNDIENPRGAKIIQKLDLENQAQGF